MQSIVVVRCFARIVQFFGPSTYWSPSRKPDATFAFSRGTRNRTHFLKTNFAVAVLAKETSDEKLFDIWLASKGMTARIWMASSVESVVFVWGLQWQSRAKCSSLPLRTCGEVSAWVFPGILVDHYGP